ncbi:MAG: BamA/TamA family outer membrane protein [Proteobacteria bacterium]|nr:BamA/TamA family outer membrane protein [Pseudomonadota bacterium]
MKRIALYTIWIAVWSLLTTASASAEEITLIEVEGNSKTRDETVILIADLEVGDDFTPDMVGEIKARLVGSGLFKQVDVTFLPFQDGLKIIIEARDKHSWVVAPTYYNQPTNKGGGVGFGENNLFGENKKLLLYGQIATGDSFFVGGYIDPSIRGSRFMWQADVYLLRERSIEYAPPQESIFDGTEQPLRLRESKLNYLNAGLRLGVNLFRTVTLSARLRAANVSYDDVKLADGVAVELVTGDPNSDPENLPAPGVEGNDVSLKIDLHYDRRANWYGINHGDRYRLSFENSLASFGSDYDYWLATLIFERARKFFSRHNLIFKSIFSYGRNLPFQTELTSGGTNLRGYKNDQFRGNFQIVGNFEYSFPVVTIKGVALRGVGFADTSYTGFVDTENNVMTRSYLPDHDDHGLASWRNTVGVGTRLFVRQIVLPLLGLDFGYGVERRSWEIYLAIGLTDV